MNLVDDDVSHLQRLSFQENPNVGVFCQANDDLCFIRKGLPQKVKKKISELLDVALVELRIADANIIGSLLTLNNKGVIVTDFISDKDLKLIKQQDLEVCVISDRFNAVGNDLLANDFGALSHPGFQEDTIQRIHETLQVPVFQGTIGTLKTVGMAAVVTNKGMLCHPKVADEEKKLLEDVFRVEVMIGTVNHGVPLIGSGLVANSNGAVAGKLTTGIEMGRIEEALHLNE